MEIFYTTLLEDLTRSITILSSDMNNETIYSVALVTENY